MGQYPEHDKLTKVKEQSQACGEFLEWLLSKKGYMLAKPHLHTAACFSDDEDEEEFECGVEEGYMQYTETPVSRLLAEFFDIDENKLEAEKRHMLAEIRGHNGR